jgi:Uma2 family endonuclease
MATVTQARQRTYTLAEYLALERYSNVRHEFVSGQILAMAGGTPEHGTFAANVIAVLSTQLRDRPCRVQTSDVRIRVQATGFLTYPDVSVVCGRAEVDAEDRDAIVNPVLLVEVTSPSTDAYDRGEKLERYRRIPSLIEILFVAHDARRLDLVRRREDGTWSTLTASDGSSLRLESVGCQIDVTEVYRDPLRGR